MISHSPLSQCHYTKRTTECSNHLSGGFLDFTFTPSATPLLALHLPDSEAEGACVGYKLGSDAVAAALVVDDIMNMAHLRSDLWRRV